MPAFTAETPTKVQTFYDMPFDVPQVFTDGHVLTAPEAAFLNRVTGGVVGNQYSGAIRRALATLNEARTKAHKAKTYDGPKLENGKPAPATPADLTDANGQPWNHAERFAAAFGEYVLGASNRGSGGGSKSDPVTRLVNALASEDLKARIIAKGFKVQDFMRAKVTVDGEEISKFSQLLAKSIEQDKERFTEIARAQLAALGDTSDSDDLLDGVDLAA